MAIEMCAKSHYKVLQARLIRWQPLDSPHWSKSPHGQKTVHTEFGEMMIVAALADGFIIKRNDFKRLKTDGKVDEAFYERVKSAAKEIQTKNVAAMLKKRRANKKTTS